MTKRFLTVVFTLFVSLCAMAQELDGKTYRVYNTTRAGVGNTLTPGTRLYWKAGASEVTLTTTAEEDDANLLWTFEKENGGVLIRSVGRNAYLASIGGGGVNVQLTKNGAVYTMTQNTGALAPGYSFSSGTNKANYLFADNPSAAGQSYRLDGWQDGSNEFFMLEEYEDKRPPYTIDTPNTQLGEVAQDNNVFKATAMDGYEFDYWSDGTITYDQPTLVYEGKTPVRLTAFFKQKRDKTAPLPPTMGWSSWNTYHAIISADNIASQTDALVRTGLAAKGYKYVNIDDGFQKNRDAEGNLLTDGNRFPNGLQSVVDHIHAQGLKAGTYSDAGTNTCASMYAGETGGKGAGFYQHEDQDCDLYFNKYRFDFVKVDYCGAGNQNLNEQERYTKIKKAIDATGRDVQYNLCRWAYPGTWSGKVADSWRTTGDIWSYWSKNQGASYSVKTIIQENLYLSAYSSPGHYNDMDMLEVGVNRDGGKLTTQESKTHFGMWCIMNSPLLIGCDVNTITSEDLDILGNEELIAVNQDPVFQQAYVVATKNGTYTLVKDLVEENGLTRAVALYNPTDAAVSMTLNFSDICLAGKVSVRNLTDRKDLGVFSDKFTATIPAHGAIIYKVEGEERVIRTLYEAETAFCSAYNELAEPLGALITENSLCSGGICISSLGKTKTDAYGNPVSNDIIWKNVYVPENCTVDLELTFLTGGVQRYATLQVNGEDVENLTFKSAVSTKGKKTQAISLKAGNNVVRLYNDTAVMPDIDCIRLNDITTTGVRSSRSSHSKKTSKYLLNKGQIVIRSNNHLYSVNGQLH